MREKKSRGLKNVDLQFELNPRKTLRFIKLLILDDYVLTFYMGHGFIEIGWID